MPARHVRVGARLIALVVAYVAAAAVLSSRSTQAQSEILSPFPMISPARAMAFLEAADRKLNYLPGEVLVKFKAGVTAMTLAVMMVMGR